MLTITIPCERLRRKIMRIAHSVAERNPTARVVVVSDEGTLLRALLMPAEAPLEHGPYRLLWSGYRGAVPECRTPDPVAEILEAIQRSFENPGAA